MTDMSTLMSVLKPTILMIIVQVIYSINNILYKLAIIDGMKASVLTAYRLIFAVPLTLALALAYERNNRPTRKVLLMSFFTGLFGGCLLNNLFLEAVDLASATFATAVFNLAPTLTFIYSVFVGLETLSVQTAAGKAKLFGTIIGIGGCMLLTFLKGPKIIKVGNFGKNFIHKKSHPTAATTHLNLTRTLLGLLASFGSCVSFTAWLIIQSKMSVHYPHNYSSATLMSMMGAIQSTLYAFCVEKDWSVWHLSSTIRIVTTVYSGVVTSGVALTIIAWSVRVKGPVFTSMFSPLQLIIVAIAGPLVLEEPLYLGSVIGGLLIICGLLMLLWGKSREQEGNQSIE